MRYVLAVLLPPVAVLLCGKPLAFVVNLILWLVSVALCFFLVGFFLIWIPIVHAWMTVSGHNADRRQKRLVKALKSE